MPEKKIADARPHEAPLAVNLAAVEAAFGNPALEFLGRQVFDGFLECREQFFLRKREVLADAFEPVQLEFESFALGSWQRCVREGVGHNSGELFESALRFKVASLLDNNIALGKATDGCGEAHAPEARQHQFHRNGILPATPALIKDAESARRSRQEN